MKEKVTSIFRDMSCRRYFNSCGPLETGRQITQPSLLGASLRWPALNDDPSSRQVRKQVGCRGTSTSPLPCRSKNNGRAQGRAKDQRVSGIGGTKMARVCALMGTRHFDRSVLLFSATTVPPFKRPSFHLTIASLVQRPDPNPPPPIMLEQLSLRLKLVLATGILFLLSVGYSSNLLTARSNLSFKSTHAHTYRAEPHAHALNTTAKRVAIIGAGASGSSAAWFLTRAADVVAARLGVNRHALLDEIVVFDKNDYFGGRES